MCEVSKMFAEAPHSKDARNPAFQTGSQRTTSPR